MHHHQVPSRAKAGNHEPRLRPAQFADLLSACAWASSSPNIRSALFEQQPARLLHQPGVELLQLAAIAHLLRQRPRHRRSDIDRCSSRRALDVAQEQRAEAGAVGRAPDQPPDVGDHEAAGCPATLTTPRFRIQRGERIVRDLRRRRRHRADQRGLAGVGKPEQADVGEQLQFQPGSGSPPRCPVGGPARVRLIELLKYMLPRPPWLSPRDQQALAVAVVMSPMTSSVSTL